MSKKNKKNQQKNNEPLPAKNQLKFLSDTLDKNHMDNTNFFMFLSDDFKNIFSRTKEDQNITILTKICADLKNLLISPFINFWSTCSYNVYFQKCLESFLRCAKKPKFNDHVSSDFFEKNPKRIDQSEQKYGEMMNEVYRLIFMLICRITLFMEESDLGKEFDCDKIIYDNWLLDVPKIMDFIAIYGGIEANKPIIKKIVTTTLDRNNDFKEDFIHCINVMKKYILEPKLNELSELKKRDKLINDIKMDARENENRFLLLLSLLDVSYIINDFFVFYPSSCIQYVILDEKMFFYIENIYYELEAAKENWRLNELREKFVPVMNQIMNNCVQSFISFFSFFSESLLNNFIHDKNSIKFAMKLEKTIITFGKMYFFSKKENENLSILKQMLRKNYDLSVLLNNLPVFLQFSNENQEKLFIFLAKIESLKDSIAKENIQEEIVIEEEEEPETENEDDEENENKGENEDGEHKNEVSEIKEKIKIEEVIISKKEKNFTLDEAERKEMAKFIRDKLEDEYDDEYDDTYDIFQETRKERVEHNNLDPDSDRDDKIENNPNLYNDDQNNDYYSSNRNKNFQNDRADKSEKVTYVPKEEQIKDKKEDPQVNKQKSYQETEEKRYEPKRYDRRPDDRRYDERRYDENRYEEKRYDDRRYDDRRYEERRFDDRGYEIQKNSDYQSSYNSNRNYNKYEPKREEEEQIGEENRNANKNYQGYGHRNEEGHRQGEKDSQGYNKRDPYAAKKQHQFNQDKHNRDRAQYKRKF